MRSTIVYGSRSGNTRRVARAIADALAPYGPVEVVAAEHASATVWDHCDLLVVGGPTEGRHATPPVRAFFDRLPAHALRGLLAAAFDTRLDWPRVLSGSAAREIRRHLVEAGATMLVPPESFLVSSRPKLQDGELERAAVWARRVAEAYRESGGGEATPTPAAA
ncbi:MAG: flavodoxin domain-containing protein [Chloroflexota bacterium]